MKNVNNFQMTEVQPQIKHKHSISTLQAGNKSTEKNKRK